MTNSRLFAATLLAASALSFAAPASAQRIDRIVAFGDSYADDGNFFQFVGLNPATTQVYTTGRFSGGTNYIDTLGSILNVPIDNFAISGALAGNFNTNVGPALGFPTQYGSFLSGGAGATPFPAVSGQFEPGDLVAVSVGGNDSRFYTSGGFGIPAGTLAGAPAAGLASAASATVGLDALVAAGARNISFLVGDASSLPEVAFKSDPAGVAAVRAAFSTSFNNSIQSTLSGYAANGVIVHYLDLSKVLASIEPNLAAFGLTGIACPAFPAPVGPGVPGSTVCATAAGAQNYIFYGDQLHLTSAGFAIVARYVAAQLEAPLTLQASSDVSLDVARQFGRTLSTRMDLGSPRDGGLPEGLKFFVVGDTTSRKLGTGPTNDSYRANVVGGTAGVEYGFGSGVVGIAGNYSRPKVTFRTGAAGIDGRSYQVGGYAGFGIAGAFAQAYAGYGWDKHDIDREGVVEDMEANPKGNHTLAGAKAGYLMNVGIFRVGPIVALDYARAKVDGYTESGDPALTLNVSSVEYSSLRGSAGVELRSDFGGGGVQLRPFAAATIEKDFTGDGRTVRFAQTASPTIVNSFVFADASKHAYGRIAGGFSAAIFRTVSLDIAGSATIGKDQGEETSAHLGLRVGF